MKPLISIIVPIYNTSKHLTKCLDSLVNQTLKEIEIILINDGSTDNSQEIALSYKSKYPTKIIYRTKLNEGQGVARNVAINLAHAPYITFVDSDDWIDQDTLENMYQLAQKNQSDIVACSSYIEEFNGQSIKKNYEFYNSDTFKNYLLNNPGPCGKLIKKDIIIQNNLYFPKQRAYEDLAVVPLWGLVSKKITFIDKPYYHYLIHEGSTMKQLVYNDKLENIFSTMDNLSKNISHDKYHEELELIYIEHLLHAASLRFFHFNKIEKLHQINKIIKENYPNWYKNIYFKQKSLKYKIICHLFYKERYSILKIILK